MTLISNSPPKVVIGDVAIFAGKEVTGVLDHIAGKVMGILNAIEAEAIRTGLFILSIFAHWSAPMKTKASTQSPEQQPNPVDVLRRLLATPPQPKKGKDKEAQPSK